MEREHKRKRGFEEVVYEHKKHSIDVDIQLPVRGDVGSAGYDIRVPVEVVLEPNECKLVFTDIKAYMLQDEVLELHIRSSIGVKKGVVLSNITGIIDSSYYSNESNDGNIGLPLWNTNDKTIILSAGERVAQGIFKKYLTVDNDECINESRSGGFGSSGTI